MFRVWFVERSDGSQDLIIRALCHPGPPLADEFEEKK
jgi:hypothetical protein